jgi:hypothetical protein
MAAMMGTMAFVLLSINFSIPILSPFAEIDLANLPELIGGFILGPIGAIQIIVVKIVLKCLLIGSESMYTGEIQNLLLSLAFVLPAVLYYRKDHTKRGAIIGLVIGIPIIWEFSVTGLVARFPSAILATAFVGAGLLTEACGLVLDTVVKSARRDYELTVIEAYRRYPLPTEDEKN